VARPSDCALLFLSLESRMNRSFILVFIPAALVAVTHSALRYGAHVALPLGIVLAVVVAGAYLLMGRGRTV
jgi:hypothetical protein